MKKTTRQHVRQPDAADRRWHLEKALQPRASEAHAVMGIAGRSNGNPEMYQVDMLDYVESMFAGFDPYLGYGVGTLAVGDGHGLIVGVGIARRPFVNPRKAGECGSLGVDIGLSDEELARVVHVEHIAVLPAWQGNGVGSALVDAAERAFIPEFGRHIFLATVHPDNASSLAVFRKAGYESVWEGEKYGGKPRLILRKDAVEPKKTRRL